MKANKKRKDEEASNAVIQNSDTAVSADKAEENDKLPEAETQSGKRKGKKGTQKSASDASSSKKGKRSSSLIIVIVLIAGLSLLLYPTVSEYWNSFHSSKAIADYANIVSNMDEAEYDRLLNAALNYNQELALRDNTFFLSDEQKAEYEELLNISGTGIMGYIEIPSIGVSLPVYHGTSEAILQIAVGHLEWSSLPVGGSSTHSVLSGHRGLPSAKLFTDLDQLENGDIFIVRVLNEVFTYEVDQILIVDPDDTDSMVVFDGEDLCTLVTCTPYGINSHRLLVRGHRTENIEEAKVIRVTSDAVQIEPMLVAPIVAIPILLVLMIGLLVKPKKRGSDMNDDFI